MKTGLKKETAAALTTLLGPTLVVPILFILLEKDEFVKFWSFQSLVVFGLVTVISFFKLFLFFLWSIVLFLAFVLWLVMTYKAWQGEKWEVPFLGKFARQLMKKA